MNPADLPRTGLRAPKDKRLYVYDFGDDGSTPSRSNQRTKPIRRCRQARRKAGYSPDAWCGERHPEHGSALEIFADQKSGAQDFAAQQATVQKLQTLGSRQSPRDHWRKTG